VVIVPDPGPGGGHAPPPRRQPAHVITFNCTTESAADALVHPSLFLSLGLGC
jgi:hypothetical protein